jgi:hypothetical protein
MEKKTFCLVLILALCCVVQAFAAEPPSEASGGGCVLTPARLGALVAAPSLCAPEPEQSPVAAAEQEIFGGGPGTEACCTVAERQACIAEYGPTCAHWYCDDFCFCESMC